ncbi:mycofactocin system transcriptional regulator [Arthrobacter pascens]|uniref:mycofactocin system transcriptional regulator n=1 Tax=Arthrobacter pascens TaxID=1677 RepID=UPI00196AD7CB|nr:mycofactocin system transcriptional regulator [Arthrobacter pascens]MBN3496636.1 mycofactocin system transcriptional regulator [Arthrobacter pascens]MDR6559774.1 mycofactocin system transcriptional regulator [Arthrobacter pascens]
MTATTNRSPGRRAVTDHGAIERAAFRLFEEQGFDETTMEQIAEAVGVGRRTLFRYFPSKNDIPWGQFDQSLRAFAAQLADVPSDVPVAEAVHGCVVAFNDFDEQSLPQHRIRMRLILGTPTLQAHSALRYAAWRGVIEDYVAARLDVEPDALLPRLAGHVSLALAVSSYEQWLREPGSDLTRILQLEMEALRSYLR